MASAAAMAMRRCSVRPVSFLAIRFCSKSSATSGKPACYVADTHTHILGRDYPKDDWTNVTPKLLEKVDRNLHLQHLHPLNLIKQRIHQYFNHNFRKSKPSTAPVFTCLDDQCPVVTVTQNFDELLIPKDHVSRKKSDSYYVNSEHLLRAHTSAHQSQYLRSGLDAFLVAGDVYRHDVVDRTHYPIFHQMEGVRLFSPGELFGDAVTAPSLFADGAEETPDAQRVHHPVATKLLEEDLKSTLEGLVRHLFGDDIKTEWASEYFPFTHPSWELNIFFQDKWLEVLGSGIMRQSILDNCGASDKVGWAFGIGLERLAMILYDIPDIRYFWSTDSRVLDQFKPAEKDINAQIKFEPVRTGHVCSKDISFWTTAGRNFQGENDLMEIAREESDDLIEWIELVDYFENPKAKPGDHNFSSYCYRLNYRSPTRVVLHEEIDEIQFRVRDQVAARLGVKLR